MEFLYAFYHNTTLDR